METPHPLPNDINKFPLLKVGVIFIFYRQLCQSMHPKILDFDPHYGNTIFSL